MLDHTQDDIDLAFRDILQQDTRAEADYNLSWRRLRERIEHTQQQQQQQELARCARAGSGAELAWQLRCHWHTIELTLSLSINPVR